jgi:hypothetical protein
MHVRRVVSVLSPMIFFVGCDLFVSAFGTGYDAGYGCVDRIYGCYEADRDRRRQEAIDAQVWEDACKVPIEPLFATDDELARADATCRGIWTRDTQLVVCSDEGQVTGAEPPDCHPFERPISGETIDGDYTCPAPIPGGYKCLCCDGLDEGRSGCRLSGGRCLNPEQCCGGNCVFDPEDYDDGGVVTGARGTCL